MGLLRFCKMDGKSPNRDARQNNGSVDYCDVKDVGSCALFGDDITVLIYYGTGSFRLQVQVQYRYGPFTVLLYCVVWEIREIVRNFSLDQDQ